MCSFHSIMNEWMNEWITHWHHHAKAAIPLSREDSSNTATVTGSAPLYTQAPFGNSVFWSCLRCFRAFRLLTVIAHCGHTATINHTGEIVQRPTDHTVRDIHLQKRQRQFLPSKHGATRVISSHTCFTQVFICFIHISRHPRYHHYK